ncbi:putative ATPase family associated with various cellular activities (AAA) [Lyophyllum shimeji]|uniref:Peroxisomal ATPase PEX6 n=1 Tax=Lyophyllum shimeji TaxID=47721 RepID=A0A9P3PGW1_LYOSH|nr:putative ATPase family associated with various cellular activities (AAA) [Lyophyllum shimeji]
MSLLFDNDRFAQTSFALKGLPDSAGPDTVLLGKDLWAAVALPADRSPLPVFIQPLYKPNIDQHPLTRGLVCWAVLDEVTEHLAIPPRWCKAYPHIFPPEYIGRPASVAISTTEPVLLTEVIVTALSAEAYQVAQSHHSTLEDWLCTDNAVLRHGDVHTFASSQLPVNGQSSCAPPVSYVYRLDMVEPVLQGCARKGTTRFIVILSQEDPAASLSTVEGSAESDNEGIEIDEAFLANSAFAVVGTPDESCSITGAAAVCNGSLDICARPGPSFRLMALEEPVNDMADHCTLYARTADLGKIGILNNDWAVARPAGTSHCRLVQIVADDRLTSATGTVKGSPILLHNLFPDIAQAEKIIALHPTPFGSRLPAVPTAVAVTVARVASPLLVNRMYQSRFLKALKAYFDSAKRLVKQGDIIVVTIDTDDMIDERGDSKDPGAEDEQGRHLASLPSRSGEAVFFCITNVEHDVVKPPYASPDLYVSSTIGELGCWVDPAVTRMVQTGVEHSWIPDVGSYFEPARSNTRSALYSALRRQKSSQLLGPHSAFYKLMQLISAASPQKAMDYKLNLSILLKGARGIGKFTTTCWVAQRLGMHLLELNCYDIVGENDTKTEGTLRARFDKAKDCSPCILVLRHIEALAQTTQVLESGKEPTLANVLQECIEDMQKAWKITGYPVVTIGTTSEPNRVPPSVLSSFKHEIAFEAPGEGERHEILECLLVHYSLAADVSLTSLATQTAALVASDLADLVARAEFASVERAIHVSEARPSHLVQAGIALSAADFEIALGKSRASYSESIGAPKIPNVSWDDVGGLANVKSDILDTIQLPLEHPELFSNGLKKRSGILLYGPPGTGKTLLAKAVATSCSLNFFSIKGPELLNMYIGESEANVRRVFQRARDAKPCVIFFDELDAVAPKRGNQGDSGGVMDRIVSQLLAELDGMSSSKGGADVFVIGATNRPDLLDPALLRPGRFDRMLYLGVSDTHEAQTHILEALTRRFRLARDLDLYKVAERCPFNYTGADLYALCSDAMLNAMSRKAKEVDEKIAYLNNVPGPHDYPSPLTPQYFLAEMASAEDINVLVSQDDFDRALEDLVPSVSESEMEHYRSIQRRFSLDQIPVS